MRPKFVLVVGLLALLVIGAVIFTRPQPAVNARTAADTEQVSPTLASSAKDSAAAPPAMIAATNTLAAEQHEKDIAAETERLDQLAASDDPADLRPILADLTSPDKDIRAAAIEAVKQFGSRDAIPTLQNLAANTTDVEEKAALLEAADFLALPSLSELASQNSPATPEQIQADEAFRNRQLQNHPPAAVPAEVGSEPAKPITPN